MSNIWYVTLGLLVHLSGADGQCNFNSLWWHKWFYRYNAGDVELEEYSANEVKRITSRNVVLGTYTCKGQFYSPPARYYLRIPVGASSPQTCVEIFNIGTIMARRELAITQTNYDVSLCPTQMRNGNNLPARIMVKYPFQLSGGRCPTDMYPGRYQVQYAQTNPKEKNCVGDLNSEAFIDTESITLKTCYKGPINYQNPHNTKLQCVGYFSPVAIDQDRTSGQIIILANTDPAHSAKAFYCARFRAEFLPREPGQPQQVLIHLSIAAGDGSETICERNKNYDSASDPATGTKYRSFLMERDECRKELCLNKANCSQTYRDYTCFCVPGTTGIHCETNIDECTSLPCQNGATCNDYIDYYTCSCAKGYSGTLCEKSINECDSNPCLNSGTCVDFLGRYECLCPSGFKGVHCEVTSACKSNPCMNGGVCTDTSNNKYTCACQSGFKGIACQIRLITKITFGAPLIDATSLAVIGGGAAIGLTLLSVMVYLCVKRNIASYRTSQTTPLNKSVGST